MNFFIHIAQTHGVWKVSGPYARHAVDARAAHLYRTLRSSQVKVSEIRMPPTALPGRAWLIEGTHKETGVVTEYGPFISKKQCHSAFMRLVADMGPASASIADYKLVYRPA